MLDPHNTHLTVRNSVKGRILARCVREGNLNGCNTPALHAVPNQRARGMRAQKKERTCAYV
jgi:hypothetical protein